MTIKKKMIEFCSMNKKYQIKNKTELHDVLIKFLKKASYYDLNELNYFNDRRIGLHITPEIIMILSNFKDKFFNIKR